MTIQDLGSIGELIAAVATIATLIYLATQVRQNTRALKSATFQNITSEMANNVEPLSTSPDLAAIMVKGLDEPSSLSAVERLRLSSVLIGSFRRLESVFVQSQLGSIDDDLKNGFEISMFAILHTAYGREWWKSAKLAFYPKFVTHVDDRLNSKEIPKRLPSMDLPEESNV